MRVNLTGFVGERHIGGRTSPQKNASLAVFSVTTAAHV